MVDASIAAAIFHLFCWTMQNSAISIDFIPGII